MSDSINMFNRYFDAKTFIPFTLQVRSAFLRKRERAARSMEASTEDRKRRAKISSWLNKSPDKPSGNWSPSIFHRPSSGVAPDPNHNGKKDKLWCL